MYFQVTNYLNDVRTQLQDLIAPYRYSDAQVVSALNNAMYELSRLRKDMFLDGKYQQPLMRGDIGSGVPPPFMSTQITALVPIPGEYYTPVLWYMQAWLQFADVADSQDQRAGAMLQKFQAMCMMVSA